MRFAAAVAARSRRNAGQPVRTPAAVPALVERGLLAQGRRRCGSRPARTCCRSGRSRRMPFPPLKKLLGDPKPAVRLEAGSHTTIIGIDAKEAAGAVPALAEGLKIALRTSRRFGPRRRWPDSGPVAKLAVPELVKKFDAQNLQLRMCSAEAAARIDPAHKVRRRPQCW